MPSYTESFNNLCHGTDAESAKSIRDNGFRMSSAKGNWCGEGVYFYDIKSKAWWSANRTCSQIKAHYGKKTKPDVVFADIIDLDKDYIFDLRSDKDLLDFKQLVDETLIGKHLTIEGVNDFDQIIQLRSMLIGFYAKNKGKKLVVGLFRQVDRQDREIENHFANQLLLVFGAETIYCVKDCSIIQNIR